jgi:hypothetical protein
VIVCRSSKPPTMLTCTQRATQGQALLVQIVWGTLFAPRFPTSSDQAHRLKWQYSLTVTTVQQLPVSSSMHS